MQKLEMEDLIDEIKSNLTLSIDVERNKLVVKLSWNDVVFCKDHVDLSLLKE